MQYLNCLAGMIVYEILGKVFDVLVAVEYYMIIGCLISVLREKKTMKSVTTT